MAEFFSSLDIMDYVWCFVVGRNNLCNCSNSNRQNKAHTCKSSSTICHTSVQYFGGLGIYKYLVDFAGSGATVPITGFGYNLAKGAIKGVNENGLLGAFTGGTKAAAGRYCSCNFLWIYSSFNC